MAEQLTLSFYNTSDLESPVLEEAQKKAYTQEQLIQKIFDESSGACLAPSEVLKRLISKYAVSKKTPITSVRRALSNLTRDGYLEKTNYQITGPLGALEYCWRIKQSEDEVLQTR